MGSFDNYNEVLKSEMPFDMEKDNNAILTTCYDDSTHESQETNQSRSNSPIEKSRELYTIESANSD